MNRRFKLLSIVAMIAMTMFGTMVCRAEASAKTNVQIFDSNEAFPMGQYTDLSIEHN